ncbi:unnamed protein product [Bemisia tabaci]|uniref:PBZ-type domain-containing protein n=1 Tax=Bemisia tabaci TaxID=7038 RepID=A0A9P0AQQ5_BEMTA|nr:unnamed protein product [Bemisia tabaci]
MEEARVAAIMEQYSKDPRTPCQYGFKCYQKNPVHHETYKHPPKVFGEFTTSQAAKKKIVSSNTMLNYFIKATSGMMKAPPQPKIKPQPVPEIPAQPENLGIHFLAEHDVIDVPTEPLIPVAPVITTASVVPETPFIPTAPIVSAVPYIPAVPHQYYIPDEAAAAKLLADAAAIAARLAPNLSSEEDKVENPAKKPRLSDDARQESPSKGTNGRRPSDSPTKSPNKDPPGKPSGSTSKSQFDSSSDEESEEETVDETTLSNKEFIKKKFLVEMPEDFYSFWSFCESLNKKEPQNALKAFDLTLVGPFDVLSGAMRKCKNMKPEDYLVHWRFYYDPPEFQTIIKGDDKKQFHLGYLRDDPKQPPAFVASNEAAENFIIKAVAENIFGAVHSYLEKIKVNPFNKMKVPAAQKALVEWAKKHDFTLETNTPKMIERNKNVVTQTFHRAGIVVPYNRKTELGYRNLQLTDAELKNTLKAIVNATSDIERTARFEKLQTVITWASIALDECDFGTGLELAIDLFCYGSQLLHKQALQMFTSSYTLLGRQEYIKIIQAHLKDRRRGADMSAMKP